MNNDKSTNDKSSKDRPTERCWLGWAVDRPGYRLFVQYGGSEVEAWTVALGWPSLAEIDAARAGGARAFAVRIVEVMEGDRDGC